MANRYDTNLKLEEIVDALGDISEAIEQGGGGGGSSAGLVSDNFSETDNYDFGDYCIHNNTLYVCINAITTPGPWDLSDWQATNAGLQLSSLNSALGGVSMVVLGPDDFTINSDIISFKNATYAAKVVGAHIVTTGGYYATGIRSVNGVKTLRAAQANTTGASILSSLANIVSVLVFLQN